MDKGEQMRFVILSSMILLVGCASTRPIYLPQNEVSGRFGGIVTEQKAQTEEAQKSTEIIWYNISPVESAAAQIKEDAEAIDASAAHIDEIIDEAGPELIDPLVANPIKEETKSIDASAASIKESAADIVDYAALLRVETEKLREALNNLNTANDEAEKGIEDIKKLEANIADLQNQLESQQAEAKAKAISRLYTYLGGMFALGFLMIVGGAVLAFFVSKKGGLLLSALGVVIVAASAALTMYLEWVALAGVIVLGLSVLSAIGYGIFLAVKSKNDDNAVQEQTQLVEMMKQDLPEEAKKTIFGDRAKPGLVSTIQSVATVKRVAAARQRLKPLIEPTFTAK